MAKVVQLLKEIANSMTAIPQKIILLDLNMSPSKPSYVPEDSDKLVNETEDYIFLTTNIMLGIIIIIMFTIIISAKVPLCKKKARIQRQNREDVLELLRFTIDIPDE
jgi:hypothetical protein